MDVFNSLKISSSALKAQTIRLNTIASNIANIDTTRTPEGGPYQKKEVVFQSNGSFADNLEQSLKGSVQGVDVAAIRSNPAPPRIIYDPSHPDADGEGYVAKPNVNLVEEITDMTSATRAYEANVTVVKSVKRMALKALEIGR
jgi:flagellar basal-body rod protein FlgC